MSAAEYLLTLPEFPGTSIKFEYFGGNRGVPTEIPFEMQTEGSVKGNCIIMTFRYFF